MFKSSFFRLSFTAIALLIVGCGVSKKSVIGIGQKSLLQSFEIIADLDLEITETSGLESYNGYLITHNDSDAAPMIYFLDTSGTILSQVKFDQLKNTDWEDIAKSDTHLFIADIGNNYGYRKDLVIYKIALEDIKNASAQSELIELEYSAQNVFEKRNQKHSFDGEAIVYAKDQLYLFSKDWSRFSTDVYLLNQQKGKQNLVSNQNIPVNGLVTGATFNGKSRIVLCGYNSGLQPFVAVLKLNEDRKLELIERIDLPIKNGAQIEAITYFETIGNQEIYYLTSEAVNIKLGEDEATTNGQLYKMSLKIE